MAGNESYYVHDLEWFVDKSRNTDISTEHIRNTRDEILIKLVKAYLFSSDWPMASKFEAWIEWTADVELCQLLCKYRVPHPFYRALTDRPQSRVSSNSHTPSQWRGVCTRTLNAREAESHSEYLPRMPVGKEPPRAPQVHVPVTLCSPRPVVRSRSPKPPVDPLAPSPTK
jgi:hypothetical protein